MNPKILLIGRSNVGKSTLFNLLTQSRRALVKKEAGTTRDILEQEWDLFGIKYQLIDTGGMYEDSSVPEIEQHIQRSNLKLIEQAFLILFIVDGKNLLTPTDHLIYKLLKKSGKPFKTIVNKMDSPYLQKKNLWYFYELGMEDLITTSFERRHGIDAILEWISSHPLEEVRGIVAQASSKPIPPIKDKMEGRETQRVKHPPQTEQIEQTGQAEKTAQAEQTEKNYTNPATQPNTTRQAKGTRPTN